MRSDQVPQDNSSTYAGHKKVLYAQNAAGEYISVQSSGWDVEAAATADAVAEYAALAEQARHQVLSGTKSPLYFHMYHARMDVTLLAQVSGRWRWQLQRHFKPKYFTRLSDQYLQHYADIFDITLADLKTLPEA